MRAYSVCVPTAIGVAFVSWIVYEASKNICNWPSTTGVIVGCNKLSWFAVWYVYVGGVGYVSETLAFAIVNVRSVMEAAYEVFVGLKITVYV